MDFIDEFCTAARYLITQCVEVLPPDNNWRFFAVIGAAGSCNRALDTLPDMFHKGYIQNIPHAVRFDNLAVYYKRNIDHWYLPERGS